MLKVNVSERLGCLKGGLKDLKRHRWFAGIDWVKLQNKELKVRRVGTAPLPLLASAPLSLSLSLSRSADGVVRWASQAPWSPVLKDDTDLSNLEPVNQNTLVRPAAIAIVDETLV
jgi:hypothetical protein